eukprot:gene7795-10589_t
MENSQNISVYIPEVDKLVKNNSVTFENIPSIQVHSPSITVEIGSNFNPNGFVDYKGYYTNFGMELELIGKMESFIDQGSVYMNLLYSYRSISQAIPEISTEMPADASDEEIHEFTSKRSEINKKVQEILQPEMTKLHDLIMFITSAVATFRTSILHIITRESNKELVPEAMYLTLASLLDTLIKIDNLKNIKTSIQKDFSRYKRATSLNPSSDVAEEITQLQGFYSSPDPKKAKNYIYVTLREEIKRIDGHEAVVLDAIEYCMDAVDENMFFTPDEKFRYIRVLPYLMLLADCELEDNKGMNIFKTSKIKSNLLQKIFRKNPVVPLYGDMSLTLEFILGLSPHYDSTTMGASWGSQSDPKVAALYNLRSHWETIRDSYSQYMVRLTYSLNRLENYPFQKTMNEVNIELSRDTYDIIKEGFLKLSKWTSLVKQMLTWKYNNPASPDDNENLSEHDDQYNTMLSNAKAYASVLKDNLSKDELSVLVDVISLIKSLNSVLIKAESSCSSYIRFHIHHRIQQLVQADLTPLLHRVDKRNNPILPSLLKIRSLAADWINGEEPRRDYKTYTRKSGNLAAKHPPRIVSAAPTQLFVLRAQVHSLYDTRSEVRRKNSIFGKADLERSDIELFAKFHIDSFYFPYILNYSFSLRQVSDLSDLWYREFFLELTHSIQFPIAMSLPWILTEHLILNGVSNAPMIENVFFVLDIYNDAATKALYEINQQFLYDEIEAEVNLVIDQLYFIISEAIYSHYKNLSASSLLEKTMKNKLEELKGLDYLTVEARRFDSLLAQRSIQILGRSINFSFILGQTINNKIYRDIDYAIKRFESADARGIIELKSLLDIIADVHKRLSELITLDPFDTMLSEVNESFSPISFRGRISLHFLNSLVQDIFCNFSYNMYTERFVSSPIAIRPFEYGKPPKNITASQAYGVACYKAYELIGKLTKGFFGKYHIESFLSLGINNTDLSMIIDQCMKALMEKLKDISDYVYALKDGIPPTKFPQYMFQTYGSYGYFEGKLRALLSYDDLKPEVFQLFREVGNTISFLKDLSSCMEISDQNAFLIISPLLGLTPASNLRHSNHESSPIDSIINHLSDELSLSEVLQNEAILSHDSIARLPGMIHRISDNILHRLGNKSLFKWCLSQIEEFMYQLNLTVDWAMLSDVSIGTASHSDYFALEVDHPRGFHRLWAALSFLFCVSDDDTGIDDTDDPPESSDEVQEIMVSNEAEFGHGFTVAGCMFLHLLGQKPIFELLDFSSYILRMHDYEQISPHALPEKISNDSSLVKDTKAFIGFASTQKKLQLQLFALFESQYKPRQSYQKLAVNRMTFHPPKEE